MSPPVKHFLLPTYFLFLFFIVELGVYCGIYRSSYNTSNISYLNSPLHHSPLTPHHHQSILLIYLMLSPSNFLDLNTDWKCFFFSLIGYKPLNNPWD
jgi:hypothetical protein